MILCNLLNNNFATYKIRKLIEESSSSDDNWIPTFTKNDSDDETILESTCTDEDFDLGFRHETKVTNTSSENKNTPNKMSTKELEFIKSVRAHSVAIDEEDRGKKGVDDEKRRKADSEMKKMVSSICS